MSMKCLNWNLHSINNKTSEIMSFLDDNNVSIFFASETWITDSSNNTTSIIKGNGYDIIHCPRKESMSEKELGGGVAIIFNKSLSIKKVHTEKFSTFESTTAKFRLCDNTYICLCSIYRPSSQATEAFFKELDEFISSIFLKFEKFLICGDLNLHLDQPKNTHTIRFNEVISLYHLMVLNNMSKKQLTLMATGLM